MSDLDPLPELIDDDLPLDLPRLDASRGYSDDFQLTPPKPVTRDPGVTRAQRIADAKLLQGPRATPQLRRAAQWAHGIAAGAVYLHTRAKTPEDHAKVDAIYEAELLRGPDFTRYRAGSHFERPPMHDMTSGRIGEIMEQFETVSRGIYRECRKKGQQGLPRSCGPVLRAFLSLAIRYGAVFPSYEGIARLACVSRRTAISCVQLLEQYGFIRRIQRIKHQMTELGRRVVQDSNAYEIFTTPRGLAALALSIFKRAFKGKTSECKNRPAESVNINSLRRPRPNDPPDPKLEAVFDNLRLLQKTIGAT